MWIYLQEVTTVLWMYHPKKKKQLTEELSEYRAPWWYLPIRCEWVNVCKHDAMWWTSLPSVLLWCIPAWHPMLTLMTLNRIKRLLVTDEWMNSLKTSTTQKVAMTHLLKKAVCDIWQRSKRCVRKNKGF